MQIWLLKTEPASFGIDDLERAPRRTTSWDGVRNYQARNMLRDQMHRGDQACLYHSSCETPGITGIVEVVKEGYAESRQKLTLVVGKDYPVAVKFQPEEVARTDKPVRTDLAPTLVEPGPAAVVSSEPEPVWKKWYLWVAIGVVVVTGVVLATYFGTQPAREHTQFCQEVAGADVYMNFTKTTCTGLFIPGL